MPTITLYNGYQLKFKYPICCLDIANRISSSLKRDCIAGELNGHLIDAIDLIEKDSNLAIITIKDKVGLDIIRRSCAYLLGHAIKKLWPSTKLVKSLLTDQGFYYDIELNYTLNAQDLNFLENKMYELVRKNNNILKKKMEYPFLRDLFVKHNEPYKVKFLEEVKKNDIFYIYCHEEHIDLCFGPIVPNTRFCNHFKLQKISRFSCQENKKNVFLQRIYGTAEISENKLNDHLNSLKELQKRDHRKIGKQLNLYHIQEDAPGMIFWHNDGWTIFIELKKFLRKKLKLYNYQEVNSPILMNHKLWEKTGHWNNYSENMFSIMSENRKFCMKPMNCPGHIQIFNCGIKTYRDLPLRIAEFGSCFRNEFSGSLHGLMRIRNFTQDDAHIFCTEYQISEEINHCIKMIYEIYNTFGFKKIQVKLSTRPEKSIGETVIWEKAENNLINVLENNNISFKYKPGEGAFYGPKIEFNLLDSLNRSWQCGTIQLDFSLSKCLDVHYINEKNEKEAPVIIHRAVLGSIERFIGILTEEYFGFFPTWLAPTQIVIMNITENQSEYVHNITHQLSSIGFRVKSDLRNEKIGFKIREHSINRIPYLFICGEQEKQEKTINVRTRYGKNLGKMKINDIIEKIKKEIYNRDLYQI